MAKQTAQLLDRHIGERLRALRLERGMSLDAVAEIIEVSQQQVSRYEQGHNRLSAAQVYRLGRGLDVPVSWFFRGYQEDKDELGRLKIVLQEERGEWRLYGKEDMEQTLLSAWYALPSHRQRERVLSMLEAFSFDL